MKSYWAFAVFAFLLFIPNIGTAQEYTPPKQGFPKTFGDLSYVEQTRYQTQGYVPYKDMKMFHPIKIADMTEQERACRRKNEMLKILNEDLKQARECKQAGTPIDDCKQKLKGTY